MGGGNFMRGMRNLGEGECGGALTYWREHYVRMSEEIRAKVRQGEEQVVTFPNLRLSRYRTSPQSIRRLP